MLLDIFPDDLPPEELGTRAILTPRNDVSLAINSKILEKDIKRKYIIITSK